MSSPLIDAIALSKIRCKSPILCDLKYATSENFLGRPVEGYSSDVRDICLLTHTPAEMLCKVQDYVLKNYHYSLLVFDAYRPLRAVRDFGKWFMQPPAGELELKRKEIHYPHLEKKQLGPMGYVADGVSKHCFAATVDVTLVDLKTGQELDMGACFDFFDELAHPSASAEQIGEHAVKNRQLLAEAMQRYGFHPYDYEYWHFDHEHRDIDEPLDIPITKELRGVIA